MTFRKILVWLAAFLLAGALALATWWVLMARAHRPLATPRDFAERSLLREMPEGAVFAAAAYDAGAGLPPTEILLPWLAERAAGNGTELSEDGFRSQYAMLKDFLGGETAAAVYTKPGSSGASVLLAARPRPAFWPKMLLSRAKERARALWGKLPEKEGIYMETLPDGSPLFFAYRKGAVFLSNDEALVSEADSSGVFGDGEEARLGWERAMRHTEGETGTAPNGVLAARLGESLLWGTLAVSPSAWKAVWTFDAGSELPPALSGQMALPPGWTSREQSALAVLTAIPAGALEADAYEADLPVRLDSLFGVLESLRATYVFPPSGGEGLPVLVACLAPSAEREAGIRESLEDALRLAAWSVEQRSGGWLSPQVERTRRGDYAVASLQLGLAHPCYATKAGSLWVATQCARLDPLLSAPPSSGTAPDLMRIEARGPALAECLRALEGLSPLLGGWGADGGRRAAGVADALQRVRLATLSVRKADDGENLGLAVGTFSLEWAEPLSAPPR